MRPTILDVARLAGVSRTTVSNVMLGHAKCSNETIENVLRIARELGYRPNTAARSLVNQRSNMVGLALPGDVDSRALTKSPFFGLTIDTITVTLRDELDFDLLIHFISPKYSSSAVVDWALQRNLEGVIFIGEVEHETVQALEQANIPMVFIDNYGSPRPKGVLINANNLQGAYLATSHLIERGYRKIAFCSPDTAKSPVNQQRYQGYCDALVEANLTGVFLEASCVYFEGGFQLSSRLLEERFDAAFAVSDAMALGLIKGLTDLGAKIPEDVAIVGYDNLDAAAQSIPELTTIDQSIYQKGSLAIRHLAGAIRNGPRDELVELPVQLVIRQSS